MCHGQTNRLPPTGTCHNPPRGPVATQPPRQSHSEVASVPGRFPRESSAEWVPSSCDTRPTCFVQIKTERTAGWGERVVRLPAAAPFRPRGTTALGRRRCRSGGARGPSRHAPDPDALQLAPDALPEEEEPVLLKRGLRDVEEGPQQLDHVGAHEPAQQPGQHRLPPPVLRRRDRVAACSGRARADARPHGAAVRPAPPSRSSLPRGRSAPHTCASRHDSAGSR